MPVGGHVRVDYGRAVTGCSSTPLCLSLQNVDAQVTIVSYGCTSEAISVIVRPWKLRRPKNNTVIRCTLLVASERGCEARRIQLTRASYPLLTVML